MLYKVPAFSSSTSKTALKTCELSYQTARMNGLLGKTGIYHLEYAIQGMEPGFMCCFYGTMQIMQYTLMKVSLLFYFLRTFSQPHVINRLFCAINDQEQPGRKLNANTLDNIF